MLIKDGAWKNIKHDKDKEKKKWTRESEKERRLHFDQTSPAATTIFNHTIGSLDSISTRSYYNREQTRSTQTKYKKSSQILKKLEAPANESIRENNIINLSKHQPKKISSIVINKRTKVLFYSNKRKCNWQLVPKNLPEN